MRWFPLLALASLVFGLSACGGDKETKTESPIRENSVQVVKYAGSKWYGHAPVWVGIEKGIFKRAGFEVELVQGGSSAQRIDLLVSDSAHFSSLGQVAMLSAMDKGVKGFYWIGNQNTAPGNEGVVARAGISKIEDLKGKRVALSMVTSVHITMADLLKQVGLSIKDVEVVQAQQEEIVSLLEKGSVEAGVIWEPFFTDLKGVEGTTLLATDKDTTIFKEYGTMTGPDVVCVSRKWLDSDKERAKRFFAAYFEAVQWCADNSEELIAIVARHSGKEGKEAEVRLAMANFEWLPLAKQPDTLGRLVKQSAMVADLLQEMEVMNSKPKVEDWLYLDLYR
ncbi:MAG: ABC transporter substrate-binding protein [Planctomycetes bacterium]|nr:ABC transporter substrate-binding protein [Planctomycetota bacterium]